MPLTLHNMNSTAPRPRPSVLVMEQDAFEKCDYMPEMVRQIGVAEGIHQPGDIEMKLWRGNGYRMPYKASSIQGDQFGIGTGDLWWIAQIPDMEDGEVFSPFGYNRPWNGPRCEGDFEFVGKGNNVVEINVHMQKGDLALKQIHSKNHGKHDYGTDMSLAYHLYHLRRGVDFFEFRTDGKLVKRVTKAMHDGVWVNTGEIVPYVDHWGHPDWTTWMGTAPAGGFTRTGWLRDMGRGTPPAWTPIVVDTTPPVVTNPPPVVVDPVPVPVPPSNFLESRVAAIEAKLAKLAVALD